MLYVGYVVGRRNVGGGLIERRIARTHIITVTRVQIGLGIARHQHAAAMRIS